LSASFVGECGSDISKGSDVYAKLSGAKADPDAFKVNGQDLVEQVTTVTTPEGTWS